MILFQGRVFLMELEINGDVTSEVSKMPCGKGLLTTSPNSPTKAISHMVLLSLGNIFFWIFAALYGKTLHWDRVCVYVAV